MPTSARTTTTPTTTTLTTRHLLTSLLRTSLLPTPRRRRPTATGPVLRPGTPAVALAAALDATGLSGCSLLGDDPVEVSIKPSEVGAVTTTRYDGLGDDLLTAGCGKSGLQTGADAASSAAPAPADPANPTAAELRKIAIVGSYRAIVDTTTAGGQRNVVLMVQVPDSFNPAAPCIITATSSGSRGVYGATTAAGVPAALATVAPTALPTMAATGNGVPPAVSVQLIHNLSVGAPLRDLISFSPSTAKQDMNLDGALCLRNLISGTSTAAKALQAGVDETRRNGKLGGKPTVIVHGRSDALLPVNHTARPCTALSQLAEGSASQLSCIEVTNAQHFDGVIDNPFVPGHDNRYIPLHLYLNRALDAVWAQLKNGTPLPPSQVLRTTPRGGTAGSAPALTAAHVPALAARRLAADALTLSGTTLVVPD